MPALVELDEQHEAAAHRKGQGNRQRTEELRFDVLAEQVAQDQERQRREDQVAQQLQRRGFWARMPSKVLAKRRR